MARKGRLAAAGGAALLAVGGAAHYGEDAFRGARDLHPPRVDWHPPDVHLPLPHVSPAVFPPGAPADMSGAADAGAAALAREHPGANEQWREVTAEAACNLIATSVESGPPDEDGWASIVTGAVGDVLHVQIGSQPWLRLQRLRQTTMSDITGGDGTVDDADATELFNELGCKGAIG